MLSFFGIQCHMISQLALMLLTLILKAVALQKRCPTSSFDLLLT